MIDGYIAYQGHANESVAYFTHIGYECPKYANPADYYMKILTINFPIDVNDEKKIKFLIGKYEENLLVEI